MANKATAALAKLQKNNWRHCPLCGSKCNTGSYMGCDCGSPDGDSPNEQHGCGAWRNLLNTALIGIPTGLTPRQQAAHQTLVGYANGNCPHEGCAGEPDKYPWASDPAGHATGCPLLAAQCEILLGEGYHPNY